MTFVFLAILAVAWLVVFLPALLRATQETPLRSAEHFRRGMEVISPSYEPGFFGELRERHRRADAPPMRPQPRPPRPATQRPGRRAAKARVNKAQVRRQVLAVMLTLAGWSAIAAVFLGGGYWELHLAIDAITALYVFHLADERRRRAERAAKVRRLPPRAVGRPNDVLLYDTWSAVEEA